MTDVERGVLVRVRVDDAAREQLCGHGAYDGATRWIELLNDLVHDRQGLFRNTRPARLFLDDDFRPAIEIDEQDAVYIREVE